MTHYVCKILITTALPPLRRTKLNAFLSLGLDTGAMVLGRSEFGVKS
jgi:hypothetical protein